MDSSVFENVNKTTKSLPNMPQHTGSLLDSSLVAKIARGLSGREGGVEEERKRGLLVRLGSTITTPCTEAEVPWCTREGKLHRGPRAVSALSLCMQREGEEAWHHWS